MDIIIAVEEEFGIEFDEDEASLPESYSSLCSVVKRKMQRDSIDIKREQTVG